MTVIRELIALQVRNIRLPISEAVVADVRADAVPHVPCLPHVKRSRLAAASLAGGLARRRERRQGSGARSSTMQLPVKDEEAGHPIPTAWRPTLWAIVNAIVGVDASLEGGVPSVEKMSAATIDQIRSYIKDYGETVANLPDETWETSVAQWMGTHWDVLVDLWTVESGASDLVLSARVFEVNGDFRIELDSVHVP
jgi:hypothetical protein